MSTKAKGTNKPLPLADVLRDLAVLRSSGVDISQVFKLDQETASNNETPQSPVQQSVSTSHQFVQASRTAIKLHDSGKVDLQGKQIDQVRTEYEGVLGGLTE